MFFVALTIEQRSVKTFSSYQDAKNIMIHS
ncbi:hypothetical protein ECO26H__430014 [Escherichia coli O26:H11]|nr:hypothetical protein ECO26H__430014 [Escherichia coli O26:H11]